MSKSLLQETYGVGGIGLQLISEQRKLAEKKWEATGFLKGLTGHKKATIATLFENQLNSMLNESTDTTGSSGQYQTVAFPIVRRVFSKLLASELVSVQAMSLPIGKLFFMNPKVSIRGTNNEHSVPDGAYSNAATTALSAKTQFETRSTYDAFYGSKNDEGTSLFDLSKGRYTVATSVVTPGIVLVSGQTPTTATVTLSGFSLTNRGKLVGANGVEVDSESFLSSLKITSSITLTATDNPINTIVSGETVPFNVKMTKYGSPLVDSLGNLVLLLDLAYGDNTRKFVGYAAASVPVFTASYRVYDTLEENSEMAEVTFELEEITVSVIGRKMRTSWTPEMAQDVNVFQNIDAEAELTALLSEQMAKEIDVEILRDLRRGAAWYSKWDADGYKKGNTYFGVQKDYNQELITKINQISAQIHKATLRGSATWVVVSSEVSALLDNLEYFHVSNADPEQDKYNLGIERIGSLSGRFQVYRDPYAPANTVLIGHKGNSILEAGYVYAPYVPMQLTRVMENYNDFKSVRGIMTRYAKKFVMNRFYGIVKVENLVTFDPMPLG